jgi:hypothetical protein
MKEIERKKEKEKDFYAAVGMHTDVKCLIYSLMKF